MFVDEILPDLDQGVGEPAGGRDGVDRVAGERAVVGLVVADAVGVEVGLGAQRRRAAAAAMRSSRSHKTPTFQRRAAPLQTGVKE